MLSKLGRKTAFIGKLGGDMFGHRLKTTLNLLGIDPCGVVFDDTVNTTLAFVSTDPNGERSFAFYRNPGADMMLTKNELDENLLKNCRIFHFGTLSSTHSGVREATRYAVEVAKQCGALISFDPNLRPLLWDSLIEAREQIVWGCAHCDFLKISDDEAAFLTGIPSAREAGEALRESFPDIKLIVVTCGGNGSGALYRKFRIAEQAYVNLKVIDTTGAGDTFCGCCLDTILRVGIDNFTEETLREMLRFAGAAAGIVTTRKGAMLAMPGITDIQDMILRGSSYESVSDR
jgi:fructokinase